MAKFFLKKDDDSHGPTHSQVVGIIWISIILLLFAALLIFLPRHNSDDVKKDTVASVDSIILSQKEDSFYADRRHRHTSSYAKEHRQVPHHDEKPADTTVYHSYRQSAPLHRQRLSVELNSADTLTLQLLHGIGSKRAQRIVEYRERLGGYHNLEQLLEVYSIDAELLADISSHLTVDTTVIHKMDINSLSLKQLLRHPYIEYYQARDIVRLREKGVTIHSLDDLRAVPSMNDTTLSRLIPYLAF